MVAECPSGTHYSQDGEDIQKDLEEDYEQQCFYDLLVPYMPCLQKICVLGAVCF